MGTDIHTVFQAKVGEKWETIKGFETYRDYGLFAHLANVRNGTGFAGVLTGDVVTPIAEPRGFPEDFEVDVNDNYLVPKELATDWEIEFSEKYHSEEEPYIDENGNIFRYMGYHDYTWVTGEEILNHNFGQGQECGVISIEDYKNWSGGQPEDYCGMISGSNVSVAASEKEIKPHHTHVRVWWMQDPRTFDYFVDKIREMVEEHGEIRVVMGFDS